MDRHLNIAMLNTNDIKGGASRAAFRINEALNFLGAQSLLVVKDKLGEDNKVRGAIPYYTRVDKTFVLTEAYFNRLNVPFSIGEKGIDLSEDKNIKRADIINFHWINEGFISLETLELLDNLRQPLVWTLHDMWAFTGGCHYSGSCTRYVGKCGKCPILLSDLDDDLTRAVWLKKKSIFEKLDMTIVTCSRWLAQCAQNSSLFKNLRIEVIPNPIDINVYKPIERKVARQILNLPEDKHLVLFGAMNALNDKRKGFEYLQKGLDHILKNYGQMNGQLELLIFGAGDFNDGGDLPFKAHFLGNLKDEYTLMLCYNAADVFVAPSLEDNLPNTVMESLACGTPVVAFNTGGLPDLVDHKRNGYLAEYCSEKDLAAGLNWVLEDQKRMSALREGSRRKVLDNFTYEKVGGRYLALYRELAKVGVSTDWFFRGKGRKLYCCNENTKPSETDEIGEDVQILNEINKIIEISANNNIRSYYDSVFSVLKFELEGSLVDFIIGVNRVLKYSGTFIIDLNSNGSIPILYWEAIVDKIVGLLGFTKKEISSGHREIIYIKTKEITFDDIEKANETVDLIWRLLKEAKKYRYILSEEFIGLLMDNTGKVGIFGAGVIGKNIHDIFIEVKTNLSVSCFFDNEELKWNLHFCGIKVLPPQSELIGEIDKIIVASQYGKLPITTQLLKLGVEKEKIISFVE